MADVEVSREVHGLPGPPIDVEAIERELSRLWKVPDVADLARSEVIPSRTSVLNLIVYAADRTTAERATTIVGQLSSYHPSRVIVFTVADDPRSFEGDVDAHVATHCHAEVSQHVATCFEQVTITTPPAALRYIRSLFVPLLLPDLPTYLWWPGQPPLHDPNFVRIAQGADRLIFDSIDFNHCPANLVRAANLFHHLCDDCTICDLNWERLHHWREMTAQFFDLPDYRWALDAVTRLTVRYGRSRGTVDNPAEALLFIGWAASRLGWQLRSAERGDNGSWTFIAGRSADQDVRIELEAMSAPRRFNGLLMSAALTAHDGRRGGQFEATRVGDLCTITMRVRTEDVVRVERAVHQPPRDVPDLLVEELRMLNRDERFEEALQEARYYADAMRNRGR